MDNWYETNHSINPSFERSEGEVEVRRNLVPNPSFEVGLDGWSISGSGAATLSRSTSWSKVGTYSAMIENESASDANDMRMNTAYTSGFMTPGKTFTISGTVRYEVDVLGTSDRRPRILVFTRVGSGSYNPMHSPLAPLAAGEYDLSHTVTIPADVTEVIVGFAGAMGAVANCFWDAIKIEELPIMLPYFDGSYNTWQSPDLTPSWTGTANASASVLIGERPASFDTSGEAPPTWLSTQGSNSGERFARTFINRPGIVALNIRDNSGLSNQLMTGSMMVRSSFDTSPAARWIQRTQFQTVNIGLVQLSANEWTEIRDTRDVQLTEPSLSMIWQNLTNVGGFIDIDNHFVIKGEYDGEYFDGSMPDAFWNGEPNNSTSFTLKRIESNDPLVPEYGGISETPEYQVELFDNNGKMIADIAHLVTTSFRYDFTINDDSSIGMTLDLVQFEKFCAEIGLKPSTVLTPYRTEIKIKRNNEYLVGGQVVGITVNFNNQEKPSLEVSCTGYLNFFKDRYISKSYRNVTYAHIARDLIRESQRSYNMIDTSDIRRSFTQWRATGPTVRTFIDTNSYEGILNSLRVDTEGPTYNGVVHPQALEDGVFYTLRFKAMSSRPSVNIQAGISPELLENFAVTNYWQDFEMTWYQDGDRAAGTLSNGGIVFQSNVEQSLYLANITLFNNYDGEPARNFGVTIGEDSASEHQQRDRERSYDLQNVKEGVINLTKLQNDNFEFQITPDKEFITRRFIGEYKPEVEFTYPDTITSMRVDKNASELFNFVYGLGSGQGEERIQMAAFDKESAALYKSRETTEMFNNVENINTLRQNTFGALDVYKNLYHTVSVNISNNTLDLNYVRVGDRITIRVRESSLVDFVDGVYRIIALAVNVNTGNEESVSLTLEKWDREE